MFMYTDYMSNYTYFFFKRIRLHLFEICFKDDPTDTLENRIKF